MFPVPRITESFIDGVVDKLGWSRYTEHFPVVKGQPNADYLTPFGVAELKIFEEEALLKKEHQEKLSLLFEERSLQDSEIDIGIENIPNGIRKLFEDQISKPFQGAIKKASRQIKHSASVAKNGNEKIIIAVNNGFTYLDADHFERIFVNRCKRDSNSIGYAICITVDYHQDRFDGAVLCTTRVHKINASETWPSEETFVKTVNKQFAEAMTIMMRDQMNPSLWESNLEPIKDIHFERGKVSYVRKAPVFSDTRFSK